MVKVLQYLGAQRLEFVDMPQPQITDDEVLLKIKTVGICGTDIHIYHGGMSVPTPLVLGHEFVGDVVRVGMNVKSIKIGDRVVAEHVIGCGTCVYCASGRKNLCLNPTVIGLQRQGALAEYLAVPAALVYILPKSMTYDQGVLVEPLSIAVYAAQKAAMTVGQSALVIGQGPIGLLLDQVIDAAGGVVYGCDIEKSRLDFAQQHGYIKWGLNSKQDNAVADFEQHTGQTGVDVVFECVGREETLHLALQVAKPGGKVVVLGVFEHAISLDMMLVVKKELTIVGSWTCHDVFPQTIELLHHEKVILDGIITHRYPFSKAREAFIEASSYSDKRIKSVIDVS